MIEIANLYKSFGSKEVLSDVNLRFDAGKVYGIVGENRAGKTTLFRSVAGMEVFEGEIKSDLRPLKNHLGFLTTEPWFMSKITGKEYIQLLCNARQVYDLDIEARNVFDLPLNQYASTYSTGMKKKLALTAILLQNNQYFILDEPFNGVDIQSNLLITEIILKLKSLNKTVLLSSHIFSTLHETCDEIHVLSKGKITRSVLKPDFEKLGEEMKEVLIGNRINQLELK